jgi:GTPase-associated protein 1, N-terminal domain type 2
MLELIHTSAPKGLFDDRSGYTTVACSEGMAVDLIAALANASATTVARIEKSSDAAANAVLRLWPVTTATGPAMVLSRIVPVVADHTGRPARLAHHLVLMGTELTAASIAAVLLDDGVFCQNFQGQPRRLPLRHAPTAAPAAILDSAHAALRALTDHAEGWAAHLAAIGSRTQNEPARLLIPSKAPVQTIIAAIVEKSLRPSALRIATTEDSHGSIATSLVLLQQGVPGTSRPIADWTNARGTASPPIGPTEPPRRTPAAGARRQEPVLDLSGLAPPVAVIDEQSTAPISVASTMNRKDPSGSAPNPAPPEHSPSTVYLYAAITTAVVLLLAIATTVVLLMLRR